MNRLHSIQSLLISLGVTGLYSLGDASVSLCVTLCLLLLWWPATEHAPRARKRMNEYISYTYRAHLTAVLIGTDYIWGGWWCNMDVTQALAIFYVVVVVVVVVFWLGPTRDPCHLPLAELLRDLRHQARLAPCLHGAAQAGCGSGNPLV